MKKIQLTLYRLVRETKTVVVEVPDEIKTNATGDIPNLIWDLVSEYDDFQQERMLASEVTSARDLVDQTKKADFVYDGVHLVKTKE